MNRMNIHKTQIILTLIFLLVSVTLLKGQDETSGEYLATIQKADDYFKKGDYINAKSSYQYASRMSPEEEYPKEKLQETVAKLREKMSRMDEYTAVIIEADNFYRKKDYNKAIEKYRLASTIISSEGYPESKIKEIEDAKNSERTKQVTYEDAIYRGDKFVKYRKYEQAIESYKKASEILPTEPYPHEQIALLEDEMEALVESRNAYSSIIDNADRLFSLKYYEQAKEEFQKATDARPDDEYPISMIAEIDLLLVKKNEFDQLVENGDSKYLDKDLSAAKESYQQALSIYPAESYPKDMITKINASLKDQLGADELYDNSIQSADKFFAAKDYTNALQEYQNAAELKPGEAYPKEKIGAINGIFDAAEASEQAYAAAVKNGDQYFTESAYANAKTEFEKALGLKPGESYPAERLEEVNKILEQEALVMASYQQSMDEANAFYSSGEFDKATNEYKNALIIIPGDKVAKAKIEEINNLKLKKEQGAVYYAALITSADKMFNENDLVAAKTKYEEAVQMDDSQDYASSRITQIDQMLSAQQATNTAYNKAIATGDIHFNKHEYPQAKSEYEKAAALKPSEKYPKNRVAEIGTLTIAVVAQNDKYTETIKEADALLAEQEYAKARLVYMKAANMRPKDQYPVGKMAEIDGIVGKQEADVAEYNRIIAAADRMMESEDYSTARDKYIQALVISPEAQYPKDKLSEIENLILNNELEVQKTYNSIIVEADLLFDQKDYAAAAVKYQNALKYKPGEGYPTQRLAEIELLSSALKKQQDNYNRLIGEADNKFTSGEYQEAKAKYVEASALFPGEEHPQVRIEEINVIIRNTNKNAQQEYDKTIADADKFFAAAAYGQALTSYRKASTLMPDEAYPEDMVTKIMGILNENAFRKLLTSSKSIQNNEQEKFSFDPVSAGDRKNSILLISVRGMGIRGFKVFVNYGKGGSKSGGFIMPIPAGDEMKEYVFELGNQYNWTSKDNNWISLTPQGGSIEVTLIEIAKEGVK